MAAAAGKTPAKKAPARKVAAPARTRRATTAAQRTAVQPETVEAEAVEAAAAAPARRRPGRPKASSVAAAAMRGTPDPQTQAAEADAVVVADAGPDATPAPAEETATVPFKGRTILVKIPTSEQLAIYRRLSRDFQHVAAESGNDLPIDEALRHLDRAVRLVQSVLATDDDKEWIEDLILEGRATLDECTVLLREAFAALREKSEAQQNRATRRAAKTTRARLED